MQIQETGKLRFVKLRISLSNEMGYGMNEGSLILWDMRMM
jgi:hypothetical protein